MKKFSFILILLLSMFVLLQVGCENANKNNSISKTKDEIKDSENITITENEGGTVDTTGIYDKDEERLVDENLIDENLIDENSIDENSSESGDVEEDENIISDEDLDNHENEEGIFKLNIVPDEDGQVLVVMYHGIKDLPPYHVTADQFRKDLQYIYDNKYIPIKMSDYVNGNIDIPVGYTPIVLTFDDGLSTAFSLENVDGELVPKEDCAVAIMEEFYKEHSDFKPTAIFYINTDLSIFYSDEGITIEDKLNWLVDNGYEISTHTASHKNLTKLNANQIEYEIGSSVEYIHSVLGESYELSSIAYPYGSTPKDDSLKELVLNGIYDGNEYNLKVGFAVGVTGPPVVSYDRRFNNLKAPRERGSDTVESTELWDFFNKYEEHSDYRFISDGMKDVVTIFPVDYGNIDRQKLSENKKIRINLCQILDKDIDDDGVVDCIWVYSEDDKVYYQNENVVVELEGDFSVEDLVMGKSSLTLNIDDNLYEIIESDEIVFCGEL